MKIALIRRHYTPFGGAERYVERLSHHLVEFGHQVHLFSHYWPESVGVTHHRVPVLPGMGLLKLWTFNFGVQRLLAKESFDLVHSFEKTWCQDVYRAGEGCHREWLLQRKKYETFPQTIGVVINPFHRLTLAMERKLFEKSNTRYFIANSKRGRDEILSHYQVTPEKIKVIYNAAPSNLPLPSTKKAEIKGKREKTILFVGSGFQRKGLYFLIQALPLVLKETVAHLVVVGQGNQGKASRIAKRVGILDNISFVGPVTDVTPYYQGADIFILPSIYEPFSNACLEAMSFGLPIVTTEMNGASEDIVPGQNGFAVKDPADRETLADFILRTFKLNGEEVRQIHQKMLIRHTWEQHMEDLIGLYKQIIKEKGL